ncbi:hypothetical protein ACYULU_10620 [Breznakiellaceae bacterium SP9]
MIKTIRIFALLLCFLCLFCAAACTEVSDEKPLVLPISPPLSRTCIGYGVVNTSYTHVLEEPYQEGSSPGYLRRGSIVKVLERTPVTNQRKVEIWLLINGGFQGWITEDTLIIFDNEAQAKTAAEKMY